MRLFFVLLLSAVIAVHAQTPQVPHKMQFAGMTLTIRDDARKEIQKDVDALTQSPRHHNIKVERAKTYFPIIEKVFEEERVPDDFKYLVIQESALIADAVSVSNAVGFWQFKDFTAVEMGLRVDKEIDERLNIVSSSRAAARYIKKNNFHFNNWLFALQAYQMGAGGAMRSLPKNLSGARSIDITTKTYWYVKKFLAHKVAFENDVKGEGTVRAIAIDNSSKKLLSDIAKEVSVSEEDIKFYNKWAKNGRIPDDRTYAVIIPVIGDGAEIKLPAPTLAKAEQQQPSQAPQIQATRPEKTKINGIMAIKSVAGETPVTLAARGGVKVENFLEWNDINRNSAIHPDTYYLLGKKRTRGEEAYHQVAAGENLWEISQKYGVQPRKIRRFNRMGSKDEVSAGMTLWLASKKPRNADKNISEEVIEVDKGETFAWSARPGAVTLQQDEATGSPLAEVSVVSGSSTKEDLLTAKDSTQNHGDSIQTLQQEIGVNVPTDTLIEKTETAAVALGKQKEHTVQPKETLYGIAHTYNVGVMDLAQWNNLNIQDGIKAGQILKVSDHQSIEQDLVGRTTIEHEVRNTDTLYSIARKYGVTIKDLMEWNNKKDFNLAVGETIKIQGK